MGPICPICLRAAPALITVNAAMSGWRGWVCWAVMDPGWAVLRWPRSDGGRQADDLVPDGESGGHSCRYWAAMSRGGGVGSGVIFR
jgi:hypothetical protein